MNVMKIGMIFCALSLLVFIASYFINYFVDFVKRTVHEKKSKKDLTEKERGILREHNDFMDSEYFFSTGCLKVTGMLFVFCFLTLIIKEFHIKMQ